MIAIDTNILVRYLVKDDADEAELAATFIERELTSERPGFISIIALVELGWVLRSGYGASAAAVSDAVRKLLDAAQLVVERADEVEAAIARPHEDLADLLIHEIGRAEGCEQTVTLDRRFARLPGVKLLAAKPDATRREPPE
jgi:predicted nucleic-acid-binding protein